MDRKLNCDYEKNLNIREIFKMYLITGNFFNKIEVFLAMKILKVFP